jgi:ribosome maturation factor RimP
MLSLSWASVKHFGPLCLLLMTTSAMPTAPQSAAPQPFEDDRFIREVGLAAQIAQAVGPVLADLGYRLVRVAVTGSEWQTLQIMAERPDGTMSANDCEKVSKQLSPILDVMDPISSAYRLEISSPGIDRLLVRTTDFATWTGYEAKVELTEPVSGRKKYRGAIDGFENDEVLMDIEVTATGKAPEQQTVGFPLALIKEARLVMTDELIRESLRRAKKAREAGGADGLMDGDFDDGSLDKTETEKH